MAVRQAVSASRSHGHFERTAAAAANLRAQFCTLPPPSPNLFVSPLYLPSYYSILLSYSYLSITSCCCCCYTTTTTHRHPSVSASIHSFINSFIESVISLAHTHTHTSSSSFSLLASSSSKSNRTVCQNILSPSKHAFPLSLSVCSSFGVKKERQLTGGIRYSYSYRVCVCVHSLHKSFPRVYWLVFLSLQNSERRTCRFACTVS